MKTYIYYIVFLLAAFVQPLLAQDAPVTKSQPAFPALPYTVTYDAAPTGGTVALSVPGSPDATLVTSGETIYSGTKVTLKVTPSTGDTNYEVVFGYPKVYCTNTPSSILVLTAVSGESGQYIFTMPKEPVTVEVKFQAKPTTKSSDTRLRALQYKIGEDGENLSVPGFTAGTKEYKVTLPSSTAGDAQIILSGTVADDGANAPDTEISLSSGSGSATLTVTAEDGKTDTYKVEFKKAEADKYIVTFNPIVEGGTLTVTDKDGNVIKSGEAFETGTELTLTNTPVAGYTNPQYTVTGAQLSGSTVTVASSDLTISLQFTAPSDPIQPESIGTPAVTEKTASSLIGEAPIVILPNAGSLPVGAEFSELQLVKEDISENAKKQEAIEDAKAAIRNTNIPDENMIPMEVTLVKVTTTQTGSNFQTTVTPVQPADEVKVRIPYPEGVHKNSHTITIIHLKSNGSTEVYSKNKSNLTLADDYMEITVTGFSPFVVAYVTKSDPSPGPDPGTNPDPDPTPSFFTVTLPAVEGVATDPVAGSYLVEAGKNFRFFLTLDKEYDESQPVVTTSRNETIEPSGSTSAYIIENVQSAVTITLSGIRKNTVVSNATLDSGLRIRTEASALYIETDRPADVRIVSISGSTIASFEAQPGTTRHSLSPGIYIVRAENKVYKVIIN